MRIAASLLLAAALSALTGCVTVPGEPVSRTAGFSAEELPAVLRVVDWNIEKGKAPGFAAAGNDTPFANADLVLLQEACAPRPGTPQSEQLHDAGLGAVFDESFENRWLACTDRRATGVLTASRVAPVDSRALVSRHREFGLTPKTSLLTVYPIAGADQTLWVMNAHLLNFEWWTIDDYAEQLGRIGDLLATHDGPILFAGDFNSRNRARQGRVNALVARIGLHPVFTDVHDRRIHAVVGGDLPLDHIYYRGLCLSAPGRIGRDVAARRSDHNHLAAVFTTRCTP